MMWDMRRSIDPGAFPSHRVVVKFVYKDAPKGGREWWLVSESGEIDLCMEAPGHDEDVIVECPLSVMTAVWTCQRSFNDAVRKRDIRVLGDPKLSNRLQDWMQSSLLSRLGTHKELPTLNWG